VIERDRAGNAPVAELARLDASGLLAITVPRSLGGPGLGAPALAEVIRTIAAVATLDEIGRVPADPAAAARGSLAVAQAKAFASDVAAEMTTDLFSLSGASATDEKYDLSRHWRNARTHASHDPVAWKYHHVGNFMLNDVLPPNHGQL
jgi:alkylation response protein AidB-like acyl-CoA dehydrogenase